MKTFLKAVVLAAVVNTGAIAAEKVDLGIVNKIRDEGFNRSQVMDTLEHLTDTIGPRLSGTPALREANDWTKSKLEEWGLKNTRLEGFEFGTGWTMQDVNVFLTDPRRVKLFALPLAWYPGTNGVLEAEVFHAPMSEVEDFEDFKDKLKGKIVLVSKVRDQKEPSNKVFTRHDAESLTDAQSFNVTESNPRADVKEWMEYKVFQVKLAKFLADEGAVALVRRANRRGNLVEATAYQYDLANPPTIPGVELANEQYAGLVRRLDKGVTVKLSIDTKVTIHKEDLNSYSTLGDIPGKGRYPEVVMAGAHLDSWHGADGAVDNGSGVAVVMEAVRILKAIGVKPKRTIRVGLWGGEEQGYYGSYAYVEKFLATRPENTEEDMKYMEPYAQHYGQFPIKVKPAHKRFSAYFNLDNGSGKIRGVYGEGNAAIVPIFSAWLKPFHDLEAKTVTLNATGGTDHEPFDEVGLPGFQFIQEPMDYGTRLHHTQLDSLGNAYEKDLMQASVIMASFLYNAAMRDEKLPRKPMPQPSTHVEDKEDE